MLVLGLNCGFNTLEKAFVPNLPRWFFHDASAALVRDGEVLAAVEQERLDRIKHTNHFSGPSARACIDVAGVDAAAIDRVAFFFREDYADNELNLQYVEQPALNLIYSRRIIADGVGDALEISLSPDRVQYVQHHLAHAYAAFFHSGFPDALVAVLDGNGEDESLTILSAAGEDIAPLATLPVEASLGHLYSTAIQLLGYGLFDEYKVMGLAPYGDPRRYRAIFSSIVEFRDEGRIAMDFARVRSAFLRTGFRPRRRGESFRREHCDFAAGLQDTLEAVALHILRYWRHAAGHRNLALAGGVVHNCSLNGHIARSGLFESVFAHPAAHDAGGSLGAALYVCHRSAPARFAPSPLRHVFLGPAVGTDASIRRTLARWEPLVRWRLSDDACSEAAALLAGGKVLAWMEGRSEFGPRALGHRSILADPRPESNRQRINDVVKKREGYRPFAPAVLEEAVADWFVLPPSVPSLDFMIFVLEVRSERREKLGAVTHVDGTARVQTVNSDTNPRFWQLITEFAKLTDVPVVLNTSFNNAAEPIVQTVDDALTCLLTTDLDGLVLEDYMVEPVGSASEFAVHLAPALARSAEVLERRRRTADGSVGNELEIAMAYDGGARSSLSRAAARVLETANGRVTLAALANEFASQPDCVIAEVLLLWEKRFVIMTPVHESIHDSPPTSVRDRRVASAPSPAD